MDITRLEVVVAASPGGVATGLGSDRAPRRNFPAKPSLHRRLPPDCNGCLSVQENHEILNVRDDGWRGAHSTLDFSFALWPARVVY